MAQRRSLPNETLSRWEIWKQHGLLDMVRSHGSAATLMCSDVLRLRTY